MAAVVKTAKVSAMPNAGAPALVDGRYVYLCTPEYMASYARPVPVRGRDDRGRMLRDDAGATSATSSARCAWCGRRARWWRSCPRLGPRRRRCPSLGKTRARSARKLGKKFVVSVELDPPKGADPGQILDRAQYCKENEVDVINVADGPRASARMSAQSLCVLLQSKVGIDTILHYTCRDRNLLGIQSDLLGAYALGLRNILAITGDRPSSATTRTPPRSTTWTRSASSGSWTTSTTAATWPAT
jgi:homocysteine S-methyltransferase